MSATEEQIADEMTEDTGVPEGIDPETGEIIERVEEPQAQQEEPAAPRSQKEIDQLTKRLENEAERHAKAVERIMGDDFALLVPSPVDWTPGFLFNVPAMHPTPEQVAELHALLGNAAPLELREAEDAEGCDKCNALGEVLTGSRKPGQETKPCTACTGTGWKTKPVPMQQQAYTPPVSNGSSMAANQPNVFQVADRWGRPVGHPHYGLEPANVT